MKSPLDPLSQPEISSGLTLRSLKRFLKTEFEIAGLPFADEDALDLVLGLTGLSQTDYVVRAVEVATLDQLAALKAAAQRRLAGEPVDRILGWREFYGRRFDIEDVLSPRGDTEVLLLAALEAIASTKAPYVLDLGTGSGALAISLLCERADATVVATDISKAALKTARRNADALGVSDRLTLIQSHWLDAVPKTRFDAVLSNPPYITSDAMTALDQEVVNHDPHGALHGGPDGLDPYREIIPLAQTYLRAGGWLGVEIGYDQGRSVQTLFESSEYKDIKLIRDPSGHNRVVSGKIELKGEFIGDK